MMRTAVAGMLVVGAALALAPPASADPGERITSYDVSVTVTSSGNAHVTETIAYDFGTGKRHGITRTLAGRTLSGQPTVTSPDGAPTTVTTTGNTIRVGDLDTTVTGAHTYVLTYDVLGSLTPQSYAATMTWNVLDGSWDVPIATMTETITAPAAATMSACWVSTSRCDSAVTVDGNVIRFSQNDITPHQTVTVTATLPSTGLTLSTPSTVPTSFYPATVSDEASATESSSRSSSAIGWIFGLGVVGLIVAGIAKGAKGAGSGRSRGSNTYYDHSSTTYYSSSDSSSSSYSDSSSSSSSDSGSSSSSSDSGSW